MAEDIKREKVDKDEDNRFELFVLEQVKSYSDMHAWAGKVYTILIAACIVMCVLGLVMGKSIGGSLIMGTMSLGFFAARMYSLEMAKDVAESGKEIEKAIEDPDFNIPDDYPEDILSLRELVCPTLKNTISLVFAYGIIALACWGGAIVIALVTTDGDSVEWGLFATSLILAAMAFGLTVLAFRAFRNIPMAKAYEEYLNQKALD